MAILQIRVVPSSSKNEITGFNENGELKIRLKAVAEKGRANKELVEFLSQMISVKKQQITLLSGHTSRQKILDIDGYSLEQLQQLLASFS